MNLCTAQGLGIAIVETSYSSGARSIADHNAVRAKASLTLAALRMHRSVTRAAPSRRASNVRRDLYLVSEAAPRGNRGDSLFHDCTRFREQGRSSAGTGSTFVSGKPAWKRPFLFGRRAPPLPAADEGGLSAPQPRLWRAVAKQDRKRHLRQGGRTVSLFGQVPKREMGLDLRSLPPVSRQEKNGLPRQCG